MLVYRRVDAVGWTQTNYKSHTARHAPRATRHGCFATAADFHPQASLAHFACGKWRSTVSVLAKHHGHGSYTDHRSHICATWAHKISNVEYRRTLRHMFLGGNVCLEIHLPHQAPEFDRTPDSTTHFIHNCPVKDVPPVLTTRLSKKRHGHRFVFHPQSCFFWILWSLHISLLKAHTFTVLWCEHVGLGYANLFT